MSASMIDRAYREPIVIGLVVGIAPDGVEAIGAVFDQFPRDFDAAVIVVLDPAISDRDHVLSLVRRAARMRVVAVVKDQPLETGSIYAMPAPRAVRVDCHRLRIGPAVSGWMDDLFASIGSQFNWRAVGLVLGQRFQSKEILLSTIARSGGSAVRPPSTLTPGACPHRNLGRRVVAMVEELRNRERMRLQAVPSLLQ
jgi:hypothetical protein